MDDVMVCTSRRRIIIRVLLGHFHQYSDTRLHIRDAQRRNMLRSLTISKQSGKPNDQVIFKQTHDILQSPSYKRLFPLTRSSTMNLKRSVKKKLEDQPMTRTKMVPYRMNAKY
jgi:hypothetical protein